MSERDFTNDYEDWLRTQPPWEQGHPEAPSLWGSPTGGYPAADGSPVVPPVPPPAASPPSGRNPNAGPDGSTFPNMDPPGYRGGYWMNGQWVTGSPYGGGGGESPMGFGGGASGAPAYQAPSYLSPGAFDPGPAFTYKDFVRPSAESMINEPGFQFRIDQGRKALEASAAGKGILRSGGTLKDILSYGQNFASQEYGNVYNRALQEYDTNRNNAADTWGKQYGQRRDVFDRRASDVGNQNLFNQRNSEMDWKSLFDTWAKQGDWITTLGAE